MTSDMMNTIRCDKFPQRKRVDVNHHFHYLIPSLTAPFGILRISKSASTSLAFYPPFNLSETRRVHLIDSGRRDVYSCIRCPIERFVSSIPETLSRYTTRHLANPRQRSAVYVSEDVAVHLNNLLPLVNDRRFLSAYLDLVEEGTFDAHHQPQVDFFSRPDGRLFRPITLFPLTKIESAIADICRIYKLKCSGYSVPVNNQLRQGLEELPILGKFGELARGAYRSLMMPKIANAWTLSGVSFSEAYARWKQEVKESSSLRCRIAQLYKPDEVLYNKLLYSSTTLSTVYMGEE